jgi:GT2 family glycosyltransferase
MIDLGILILNYNGLHFLKEFLPQIINTSNNYPIIIGDNASTDGSIVYLQTHFPQVRCIEFKDNLGYAEGYNQLIQQVTHEYLVIMNSDISTTDNWLAPLITFLQENPNTAAVQPKIKSHKKPDYFEYAGASGGYIDQYGYPYCRGRVFETLEKDQGQYDDQKQVFWASGACFAIRKRAFDEAGGFDGEFFAHMEEIDLCWRLQKLGHEIYVVPESEVYHVGGGTLDYQNPFKTYLNFRNGLFLLAKNLPPNERTKTIRTRMLLDGLSAVYFMLQGKFKLVKAVVDAHQDYRKQAVSMMQKGDLFNAQLSQPQQVSLTKLSVVKAYFIKGKKTFSDLIPNGTSAP